MKDYFWQCSPILISDVSVGIYRRKIFKYYGIFNSKKICSFYCMIYCQNVPDIAMECHPPAATHFILTPVRSSTRQGCSLVSTWPKPSWPRLKIIKNIISKKYLKRRKLLLKNVFCGSTFILFSTGTLHLLVYISEKEHVFSFYQNKYANKFWNC